MCRNKIIIDKSNVCITLFNTLYTFTNISCDVFIRGLIQALRDRYENNKLYENKKRIIPIYGRMVGTDLPSAKTYLEKAKKEFPEALSQMEIVVGNEMIMADIIREGIKRGFEIKQEGTL